MLGHSEPGSNDNEGVLHIPQGPCITGTSPSDCLVSYLGHSLGGVLPFSREAVGVFYSPSWLGKREYDTPYIYIYMCVCVCVCVCVYIYIYIYVYIYIYIYIYISWTLTKWLEKKLDGNYTRMLQAILNRSWPQHPTWRQLYGHLPPITKTIHARRTRHIGHCWRSKDEIVSDVLLWTPAYGQSKAGRPAWTFIQQLCDDMGCNPEDLPEVMNNRETVRDRERVRDIRASRTSWWWYIYI